MTNPVGTPPEDDTIARLLEAAGPRSTAPKEREDRVRDAARAHWRRRASTTSTRARAAVCGEPNVAIV